MPIATSLCIWTHGYSKITCVEEGEDQKFMVMLVYVNEYEIILGYKERKQIKIFS